MEVQLIAGTFTIAEAEQLLTELLDMNSAIMENRLVLSRQADTAFPDAKSKMLHFRNKISSAIATMKERGKTHTVLNAYIEVNTTSKLSQ